MSDSRRSASLGSSTRAPSSRSCRSRTATAWRTASPRTCSSTASAKESASCRGIPWRPGAWRGGARSPGSVNGPGLPRRRWRSPGCSGGRRSCCRYPARRPYGTWRRTRRPLCSSSTTQASANSMEASSAPHHEGDPRTRPGLYKAPLPLTLGQEAAGAVAATGPGVSDVKVGARVAYAAVQGAYAEYAVVPADRVVVLPDGVSSKQAAAVVLQGITAHYLASTTYALKPGDTCLVHAAAGGVGSLLCQIAKLRGARVIGTVSTPEKAALASEAGADEVIRYTEQDFEAEVKRLTDGAGLQMIYDSV